MAASSSPPQQQQQPTTLPTSSAATLPPPPPAHYDEKQYQLDEEGNKKRKRPPLTERNKCCRCLCCACCLPVWARYIVWFIIIGIIICIIVIGGILGSFKMPTVEVLDVTNSPGSNETQITYNGTEFDINIGLVVNVQNPNVLPIHLSDMQATANIRTSDDERAYLGSGFLNKQIIPTNSDYNFTFPFTIRYDTQSASSSLMLNTLLTDCGLYGGEQSDINVEYTIQLAARVLFVTIHPNLSGSTSFACPLSNGGLPGFASLSATSLGG
ncbi:hypothetical protein RO3G_09124 [Lichtheimia corymbifera JMRC:FSU:9682]|uniref:Late embryogenesis abundant protein LEA-2 subgroup domain-containing protein n=1 Tax=Lichtheimia corymbifera JMRC:FSU:9682 TaxID=1263082 RepID=A0A068RNB0_9FUNG|nr:hypothetical protein RO3G_09124 [Lichtheimia corymbifera JMRC:FSU:9682]